MTHKELVKRAERWLRNTLHCRVVLSELVSYTQSGETPDAIGFKSRETILVECKMSKSDFYADRKKPSRNWRMTEKLKTKGFAYPALGDWRFYLTYPGLLDGCKLPNGWGWYEVHGRYVKYKYGAKYHETIKTRPCKSHWQSERAILLSALARVQSNKIDVKNF